MGHQITVSVRLHEHAHEALRTPAPPAAFRIFHRPDRSRSLLPCEAVVARDVLHEEPAGAALDKLNAESIQTAKLSFGRCDERYLPSAVHVGEKLAVRDRDLDDSGNDSPERGL